MFWSGEPMRVGKDLETGGLLLGGGEEEGLGGVGHGGLAQHGLPGVHELCSIYKKFAHCLKYEI